MNNNKQSSVQWLIEQIHIKHPIIAQYLPNYSFDKEIIEQAEEKHMKEIIKSCNAGLSGVPRSAKQYYEQEYGK